MIIEFSCVLDALDTDFFGERRIFLRNGRNFGRLRRKAWRKSEENCERRAKKNASDRELDAKSLEGVDEENDEAICETAPLDIDALGKN